MKKQEPPLGVFAQSWFGDTELRLCSTLARCVWFECLMLMHGRGEPYGHLARAGGAWPEHELVKTLAVTRSEFKRAIAELEARNVFSRTDDGLIYSRKLVRDEARRLRNALNGKLGGNPSLPQKHRSRITEPDNRPDNHPAYPSSYPSRINTVTNSLKAFNTKIPIGGLLPPTAQDLERRQAWLDRNAPELGKPEGLAPDPVGSP